MISQELRDDLLNLIVGTFGAAPTADIMQQLEAGLEQGATLQQYAQSFINSQEFNDLYPDAASFQQRFTEQLLGDSVDESALADAGNFISQSLANGANLGDLLLTSIQAVSNVPEDDPVWSGATKQLSNKKAVAEYFTKVLQAPCQMIPMKALKIKLKPTAKKSKHH